MHDASYLQFKCPIATSFDRDHVRKRLNNGMCLFMKHAFGNVYHFTQIMLDVESIPGVKFSQWECCNDITDMYKGAC